MTKRILLPLLAMVFMFSGLALADPYESQRHNWRNKNTFNHETIVRGDITLKEGAVTTKIVGTNETASVSLPFEFLEEFCWNATIPDQGSSEAGTPWARADTGSATITTSWDKAGGVVTCALTAASQKQEGTLFFNNNRILDMSKGLIWEARIKLPVLPTGTARMYWGLAGDEAEEASATTYHALFKLNGSGAVNATVDDATDVTNATTGKTLVANEWATYRIDCTNKDNIKFFINDFRVMSGTTFNATGTGANCILQPYISVYKASGTDVGTIYVDYFRAWQKR